MDEYKFPLSKQQKQRIAETIIHPLLEGVTEEQIFREIEQAALQFYIDYGNKESPLKTLEWVRDMTFRWTRWRKRGRPELPAEREYLKALVVIYHNATGHWLRRKVIVVPDGSYEMSHQEDSEPHPFIVECLAVIRNRPNGRRKRPYSRAVFEDALRELKTEGKMPINVDDDEHVDWLHPKAQ